MNILSYRGPSTPGGVSATLSRVIERSKDEQQWWYLHGSDLRKKIGNTTTPVCQIPFKIVEGHYRYCNNFLWPILHELPEYAIFNESDSDLYQQLNKSFAWNLLLEPRSRSSKKTLINDYQLAYCPKILFEQLRIRADIFWHIPWPEHVREEHVPFLRDLANSLLCAQKIGFHVESYVSNFLSFVDKFVPDYRVDFCSNEVIAKDNLRTSVVARPLGIDNEFWQGKSKDESAKCLDVELEFLSKQKFVLSVDRADYTKGIFQRLQAIEHFFQTNREQRGRITFVQVCQPTRMGLENFDEYWRSCRFLFDSINSQFGTSDWKPILWIDTPLSSNTLAWLYKRATLMLITPLYDGLNLTAKEFAVCSEDGILMLSNRAGAWHELKENVVTIDSITAESISMRIMEALSISDVERRKRMVGLKQTLTQNCLSNWWQNFGAELKDSDRVVPLAVKLHHTSKRDSWMA